MNRIVIHLIATWASCVALTSQAHGQLCVQLNGGTQSENFNGLATTGTSNNSSTLPIGFAFAELGSGANVTYAAGDGLSSTPNTYSFGSGTNTERALGEVTGTTLQSVLGACFTNNTNAPISWFLIKYTGEQWRRGASGGSPDRLDFQYSANASSLTSGTYSDANELDFVSPSTAVAGALNGNSAANRIIFPLTAIEFATPVPPGGTFYIRWVPLNIAGVNDGLAIDDVSITVASGPPACPADVIHNDTVDINDLVALITSWGTCP